MKTVKAIFFSRVMDTNFFVLGILTVAFKYINNNNNNSDVIFYLYDITLKYPNWLNLAKHAHVQIELFCQFGEILLLAIAYKEDQHVPLSTYHMLYFYFLKLIHLSLSHYNS